MQATPRVQTCVMQLHDRELFLSRPGTPPPPQTTQLFAARVPSFSQRVYPTPPHPTPPHLTHVEQAKRSTASMARNTLKSVSWYGTSLCSIFCSTCSTKKVKSLGRRRKVKRFPFLVEHVEHMEHAGYDRGRRAPAGLRPPGTRLAPRPTAVGSSTRAAAMRPAFAPPPPPRPRLRATSHPLTPSALAPNHRNDSLFAGPATAPPPPRPRRPAPRPRPPPPPPTDCTALSSLCLGAHAAGGSGCEPRAQARRRGGEGAATV